MPEVKVIQDEFDQANARRSGLLRRVREAAMLTVSTVLPPQGLDNEKAIPQPFQSLGSIGINNLVSRLLTAIFPPQVAWFQLKPSAAVEAMASQQSSSGLLKRTFEAMKGFLRLSTPLLDSVTMEAFLEDLYVRELLIASQLEDTAFRAKHRTVFEQCLVAGNWAYRITDDYRFINYRLDHYVQKKSGDGQLLWIIARENTDPVLLSDEVLAAANLSRDEAAKQAEEGRLTLYTRSKRQQSGGWLIEQELNKRIANVSQEPVNPFVVGGFVEMPGEHYSRGFVELNIADLRSHDGMTEAELVLAINMAKVVPVADESQGFRTKDFLLPNGQPVAGRVTEDNRVRGAAFLTTGKSADAMWMERFSERVQKRAGQSMLLESSMQPEGERVTAFQVGRIARELEGALGGVYGQIAEECQRPLLERITWQMERDKKLLPIPNEVKKIGGVVVKVLTGLEALGRTADADRWIAVLQIASQTGMIDRFNLEVILPRILRAWGVDTRDTLLTEEQYQAKVQAAREMAMQAMAGQQIVQSAGKIAEISAKSAAEKQRSRAAVPVA